MCMTRSSVLLFIITLLGCAARPSAQPDHHPDFDAWWDYDDPAGTQARFEQLRDSMPISTPRDYRLQLKTQIARALGLQRKFAAADQVLVEVANALNAATPAAEVRYLLERGRVLRSSGHTDRALPLFERAFERARLVGTDYHAVDAAHMVALAVDSAQARRDWSLRGIAIASTSKQPRTRHWLGSIYNNLGWDYHDAGEFDAALEMFQQALTARQQEQDEAATNIAHWSVARCYRSLGRVEAALEIQQALLAKYERASTPDGYVHEELGELYLLMQDDRAAAQFAAAYGLLSADSWLQANEAARLQRLRQLGGLDD